jgi:hypothetical protein
MYMKRFIWLVLLVTFSVGANQDKQRAEELETFKKTVLELKQALKAKDVDSLRKLDKLLQEAVRADCVEKIRFLFEHNLVAPTRVDQSSKAFFMYAAQEGALAILQFCYEQDKAVLNLPSGLGDTALHQAVHANQIDVVRKLLAWGVDVHMRGKFGMMPFHIACQEGHSDIAALLQEHGANIWSQDGFYKMNGLGIAQHCQDRKLIAGDKQGAGAYDAIKGLYSRAKHAYKMAPILNESRKGFVPTSARAVAAAATLRELGAAKARELQSLVKPK